MSTDKIAVWGEKVLGIEPPDRRCPEFLNNSLENMKKQFPDAEVSNEGEETHFQFRRDNQTFSLIFKNEICIEAFSFSDSNLPPENIPHTFKEPDQVIKKVLKHPGKRLL